MNDIIVLVLMALVWFRAGWLVCDLVRARKEKRDVCKRS